MKLRRADLQQSAIVYTFLQINCVSLDKRPLMLGSQNFISQGLNFYAMKNDIPLSQTLKNRRVPAGDRARDPM